MALLEPWACVEKSYSNRERQTLKPGGRLLVAVESGATLTGMASLLAAVTPTEIVRLDTVEDAAIDALGDARFDDIVYAGASADRIEALQARLAPGGILDIALGGARVGRAVAIDVGRVHYDPIRFTGTLGTSAADGYAKIPESGELRDGDTVAIVGAAGPMGFMHTVRAATIGRSGLQVAAIDIDSSRLAHLADVAGPVSKANGVEATFIDSRETPSALGWASYVGVMVPAPALVVQAVAMAAPGARLNLFAGFAVGTRAELDLNVIIGGGMYLFGTSGSEIPDMQAVLARLEAGRLDTNVSLDAVCGMEGVRDALAAVEARSSGGKIVVYPMLHDLGLVKLSELPDRFPTVAAKLTDGRWNAEAEAELLKVAGA